MFDRRSHRIFVFLLVIKLLQIRMARMGGGGHMPNTRCGGMSSPGEPDQEVQDLCNKVGMIDSSI